MDKVDLEQIDVYSYDIDRNRIRFNGIGPRLHDQPNKIWPRDYINPHDEARKILQDEVRANLDRQSCDRIDNIVITTFEALKRCNVSSLFNKFCPLDHGYFNRVAFDVHYALDAHTSYDKVIAFIHQSLRSISGSNRSRSTGCHLKLLFGSNANYDIFKRHIRQLVVGNMSLRRVLVGHFIKVGHLTMDLKKVSWIQDIEPKQGVRIFMFTIYALAKFALELIRRYFYVTVSNPYNNKLFYFRYDLWHKIQTREIQNLVNQGIFVPQRSSQRISRLGPHSKLKFYLKKDGLRLICSKTNRYPGSVGIAYKLRAILTYISKQSTLYYQPFSLNNLLVGLKQFRADMTRDPTKSIYIVRADIKDCFQSICQNKLREVILNSLRTNFDDTIPVRRCYQMINAQKFHKLRRKKRTYTEFWAVDKKSDQSIDDGNPNSITESNDDKFTCFGRYDNLRQTLKIQQFDKNFLEPSIIEPVVKESNTSKVSYNLVRGLPQGSKFSPVYCSIYIQAAFEQYIPEFLISEDCKIFRYVDDILFISTNRDMSQKFMHKMLKGFKDFNLQMNLDKLACNFKCPGLDDELCSLTDYAIFYKQRISTTTLQCSYDYCYKGIGIHYCFRASAYVDKDSIESMVANSTMPLVHLDMELNTWDQVLINIFERAALIAHKVGALFLLSIYTNSLENQQPKFLLSLVVKLVEILSTIIYFANQKGIIENNLDKYHIRTLVSAAFFVTWSRNGLRQRVLERKACERTMNRYMMRFLTLQLRASPSSSLDSSDLAVMPLNSSRDVQWESKIKQFVHMFPSSSFAKEVLLPKKHSS